MDVIKTGSKNKKLESNLCKFCYLLLVTVLVSSSLAVIKHPETCENGIHFSAHFKDIVYHCRSQRAGGWDSWPYCTHNQETVMSTSTQLNFSYLYSVLVTVLLL